MQVTLLFCNEAKTETNGTLSMQGIFNELYAPGFPARQDAVVLAGLIEWDRDTQGMTDFMINLNDAGGKSIFTIEGRSEVEARNKNQAPAKSQLLLTIDKLVFPEAGEYQVETTIEGVNFGGPSPHVIRSGKADL